MSRLTLLLSNWILDQISLLEPEDSFPSGSKIPNEADLPRLGGVANQSINSIGSFRSLGSLNGLQEPEFSTLDSPRTQAQAAERFRLKKLQVIQQLEELAESAREVDGMDQANRIDRCLRLLTSERPSARPRLTPADRKVLPHMHDYIADRLTAGQIGIRIGHPTQTVYNSVNRLRKIFGEQKFPPKPEWRRASSNFPFGQPGVEEAPLD